MIETGQVPKGPLREHPELRRALTLLNRMEAGVSYDPDDLGYKEMKMVELVQGAINEARQQKMQEIRDSAAGGGGRW